MKEIVTTENTLYRNLYLVSFPNGFDAHFITQLIEAAHENAAQKNGQLSFAHVTAKQPKLITERGLL
jgi:hypothetical protein